MTALLAYIRIPSWEHHLPTTIALLTDFGLQDSYVGIVKGVITAIEPQANVVDLTHAIPPGDVRLAAFELWRSVPFFPDKTIFTAVVDPGVGTSRLSVAVVWPDKIAVGPDNGLFTYLIHADPSWSAYELTETAYQLHPRSATFHGRDVFAPAAAHLAAGIDPSALGPALDDLMCFSTPLLNHGDEGFLQGEIIHTDQFGNAISSIGQLRQEKEFVSFDPWLPDCQPTRILQHDLRVRVSESSPLPLQSTFGDVAPGQPVAYIGSSGLIEIAIRSGSAMQELGIQRGQRIQLEWRV